MSLLMDALKKAEEEKKDAAKRLREAQAEEGDELELTRSEDVSERIAQDTSQGLNVTESPYESDGSGDNGSLEPATTEIQIEQAETAGLSLEPMSTVTDDLTNKNQQGDDDATVQNYVKDITIEHPELSVTEVEAGEATKTEVIPNLGQTFAITNLSTEGPEPPSTSTLADEDTVQLGGPDEYSETIGGSKVSRTVVSAAELASAIGTSEGHPTPVAAQTVFTAIGRSRVNDTHMWITFIIFCAVVTVALCVIIYNNNTISTSNLSSPLIAQGIESDPDELPVIATSKEILTGTIITQSPVAQEAPPDNVVQTTDVVSSEQAEISDEALASESSELMQEEVPKDGMREPSGQADNERQVEDTVVSSQPIEDVAVVTPFSVLPETINTMAIKISRSKAVDRHSELINDAYNAYISGNYTIAEAAYEKVLKQVPGNRDALLGLSAIAVKQGNIQQAYAGYLEVLKLHPKDNVAQAALISMQNKGEPVKSESAIKLMLHQQPDAPFLYFTLGNLYAVQSRWADAQQAFFDAYRLDSSNPDYAFNLAVSLDHIGQVRTALDYYNVALQLADNNSINFNPVTVAGRIDALSAVTNPN